MELEEIAEGHYPPGWGVEATAARDSGAATAPPLHIDDPEPLWVDAYEC